MLRCGVTYGLGEQKTVLEKTKWNSHKYFCKLVSRIAVSFFKEKVFCESFYGPSCLNDPKKKSTYSIIYCSIGKNRNKTTSNSKSEGLQ